MKLPIQCLCVAVGVVLSMPMGLRAQENDVTPIESQVALQEILQDAEEKSDALAQVCLTLVSQEEILEETVQEGSELYTELKQEVEVLKATAQAHEEWKEEIESTLSHCLELFDPVIETEHPLIEQVLSDLCLAAEEQKSDCCSLCTECCCEEEAEVETFSQRFHRAVAFTFGTAEDSESIENWVAEFPTP